MKMPKATDEDKAHFRSLIADAGVELSGSNPPPNLEVKPMFGQLGAFVNGNMFAGMYGETIGAKLAPSDLAELSAVDGAGPFIPVKPMKEWLALPASYSDEEITAWLSRAYEHVATLPPKVKK